MYSLGKNIVYVKSGTIHGFKHQLGVLEHIHHDKWETLYYLQLYLLFVIVKKLQRPCALYCSYYLIVVRDLIVPQSHRQKMAVSPMHRKHQFLKKPLLFMGGRREKRTPKIMKLKKIEIRDARRYRGWDS